MNQELNYPIQTAYEGTFQTIMKLQERCKLIETAIREFILSLIIHLLTENTK